MPKPQYTQKFRSAWLKDPSLKDWLQSLESTSGVIAKCKFCSCTLVSRYADLKSHGESKKHKNNSKLIMGNTQPKIPFEKVKDLEGAKVAEARLALFIAKHTSINTTDHLVDTCKNIFKCNEATYLKMHRTKCSAILKNVLAPHFKRKLSEDIGNTPFSILLDESTDITTNKYLGCTIIFFSYSKKKVINSYLDLMPLEGADADSIANAILETLKKNNLRIKNLMGIGTDNASVMIGINNGVYAKLKEYAPNLVLIRCVCHSLQLAVSAAAKEHLPRNIEFLIRETYNWFSHSSMRQMAYKQLYNLINDGHNPLKITQSCTTRWLSIETAVTRIFNQWTELKTHFQIAKDREKCYTAQILFDMYNDERNYVYMCFLQPILVDIQKVNKAFEQNNADSSKLLRDLKRLLNSLIQKVVTPNSRFQLFNDNIDSFIDRSAYMGYLFEQKLQEITQSGFAKEEEHILRTRCMDFLVKLIKEIMQRLPDNIDILEQISLFAAENTLKRIKPSLVPLLQHFNTPPDLIDRIERQWNSIVLIPWQNINATVEFWSEVISFRDGTNENPFQELSHFAISFLVLPHSNAEVERLFSQMNLIKSKLRNRMQLEMLNALLCIRSGLARENTCCSNYNISEDILSQIKTSESYLLEPNLGLDEDFDIFI